MPAVFCARRGKPEIVLDAPGIVKNFYTFCRKLPSREIELARALIEARRSSA